MGIRKRGNAWQIVIDVGTKEKRQQKVFTFYGTKTEARAEEARLKAMYKHGSALPGKMTVEQYMLYWLDTYKKRKLAVRTYESYKETIEKHIAKDDIGKLPFERIKPDDIQKYYNRKLDQGLSATTVLYHHRILHAAYAQAVKSRLIPWGMNPCAAVEPPERAEHKRSELSPEQMAFIIMGTAGKPIRLPIIISAMTGARAGEVCGLKWPDIDFKGMTIHIHQAIKREQGKLVLGTTKNRQSRYVPLTPGLKKILEWHKQQQENHKAVYKKAYRDEDYVVAWEDGRHFDPHYLSEKFTAAIKDMKFQGKVTFHSCRHFFASAMQKAVANLKYISDALGHGKLDNITADVYIHTQLEDMRKYVNWLDDAILKGVLADIEGHK
jgi:integrase